MVKVMISRRQFLKGLTLTAAGLLVPESLGRVFYSIPKVVVPQNLGKATYYWSGELGISFRNTIPLKQMQVMFDKIEEQAHVFPNVIRNGKNGWWIKCV